MSNLMIMYDYNILCYYLYNIELQCYNVGLDTD